MRRYDRERCFDGYANNPDDDIFDMQTQLNADTGVFDMQTQLSFDDGDDDLSDADVSQMIEIMRMSFDWRAISKIMAREMPAMASMLKRGLHTAFYDKAVQEKLKDFLVALTKTADRSLLVNPSFRHNPEHDVVGAVCGECGSSMADHTTWCHLKHWQTASKKKMKRRNPGKKRKKTGKKKKKTKTPCKKCGKNIKQSGRGRPKSYHPRCKKK